MSLLPWNAATTVNATTASNQNNPKIATLNNGNIVVTWVDYSEGHSDIRYQIYDALGNKITPELIHGQTLSNETRCDITALTNGGFVISYVGDGNIIYGQRFGANGAADGTALALSEFPSLLPSPTDNLHKVQALAGGGYAVVYNTNNLFAGSGTDLVMRLVDATGTAIGSAITVTSAPDTQQFPDIALTLDNNIIVTWTDSLGGNSEVFMEIFSPFGVSVSGQFSNSIFSAGSQDFSSITRLSDGQFVVTWSSSQTVTGAGSDIRGLVFGTDGTLIDPDFLAGTTRIGDQQISKVVALADGQFMVVYQTTIDLEPNTLRAQVFNSNRTTAGSQFTLTNSGEGQISFPDAVTLADGRVAVTWADNSADGDGTGIFMQILDPREGYFRGTANADAIYGNNTLGDFLEGMAGSDTIFGMAGADALYGGSGNDTLHGGRGDDTLFGGADQDSLLGGVGADEMDGGDGVDTANYALAAFAVTASLDGTLLGTNEALDDTYVSIENLTGTNIAAQGDTLRGNAAANSIAGLAGADTLNGVGGHDRLTGGTGIDTMTGGIGNDSFIYNTLTEGGDIITDFSSFAANNNDVFRFKGSVFGGLAAGAITAPQFQSSTSDVATTGTVDFFFETDTGILRFDADGSGAGAAVTIATLQAGATMTFNDILIF